MVHTVSEMERAGLDIPVIVGGATTSKLHTALKIAPAYHAPVVHLKDASQNAPVAAKLLNPEQKKAFVKELYDDYKALTDAHQEKKVNVVSLDEARENRLKLWD